ncbi:asparaginase [Notoacmeibacter sp. MSK16QG-6]|uniref:asparaginase n=1 Tax=Notoacmeibacter sp. MSK16QG-6 TaxID=2957982 RepID=UPI0020A1D292|nr:asparaginase [Notoacmeibacter sp. MSK16QG-6]MCP1198176.1 asparaginase [Notoacmeibacter sp. MSK16QG-6]
MADNPVLVEVTRGSRVESFHRGAFVAIDADGAVVMTEGDVDVPIFPRSAVKLIQALPLIESGAADDCGLTDSELALAGASHSGEPGHVEGAAAILSKAGLEPGALECGSHWPMNEDAARRLFCQGVEPYSLHNNCSGKHAGFVCTCRKEGWETRNYVQPDHPMQVAIRDAMVDVTGVAHDPDNMAIDGCSIPTYAIALKAMATGMAKMASGRGLDTRRAKAASRLMKAAMNEPWHVAGTGRACTLMMQAGGGRLYTKTGAEGVYCGAIPELGIGFALKCDDGKTRASEAMVAALVTKLLPDDALADEMAAMARTPIKTRIGAVVGEIRPSGPLS